MGTDGRHSMKVYFSSLATSLVLALAQVGQSDSPSEIKKGPQGSARTDLYGDPLPPGTLSRIGTIRFRQSNTILSIAYAPDGSVLAVSTHDGIHLWQVSTGKQLQFFPAEAFYSMAFSPDG